MKHLNNLYRNFVLMTFLLLAFKSKGQITNVEKKIILIDAGHGGTDSGAISINGVTEKDVVLFIALEIIRLNELKTDGKLEIYLTRYSDTLISLTDRTKLAKSLRAEAFISLHCNHSNNSKARGIEVYVSNSTGKYLKQSVIIGYEIEKDLVSKIGIKSRGVKFADFQVLRESVNYFPSMLLEFGFLSNMDEANYFSNDKNLEFVASLILEELIKI